MPSIKTFSGINFQGNPFSEVPEGSCAVAINVVSDREGTLALRRGFSLFGDRLDNPPSFGMFYNNRLLVLDGDKLKRDSTGTGTWVAYSGTYAAPTGGTMKAIEVDASLFFTSNEGLMKLDSLTGTPKKAGTPQGLDIQLSLTGFGGDFFESGKRIGYKVFYIKKDANKIEAWGSPSWQRRIANPRSSTLTFTGSGTTIVVNHTGHGFNNSDLIDIADASDTAAENGAHIITLINIDSYSYQVAVAPVSGTLTDGKAYGVVITTTIPKEMVAGDYMEYYRTPLAIGDVGDDHNFIVRYQLTATDISNGYVTYTDTNPATGVPLYTNAGEETAKLTRDRPPFALYSALWKGHLWLGYVVYQHLLEIRLKDLTNIIDNTSTISIYCKDAGLYTYTFSTAEDIALRKFKHFTTGIDSQNIEDTMQSLCHIINRDPSNAIIDAHYVSGETDESGKIQLVKREVNTNAFSLTANLATTGNSFTPILPTSGTTLVSDNDANISGLAHSIFDKMEAFPRSLNDQIGSKNKAIIGLLPLPDSLLIYTEQGIYSIGGETDGLAGDNFLAALKDTTLILTAPDTLRPLDNTGVSFTTQYVTRSTSNGSAVVSHDIEPTLEMTKQFRDFSTKSSGVAYESSRKYLLLTKTASSNTHNQVIWVWNYITKVWTLWTKPATWGIVSPLPNDKLYLGHANECYVLVERKSLTPNDMDYVDETIGVTIQSIGTTLNSRGVSVSTATFSYTWKEGIIAGSVLEQGHNKSYIVSSSTIAPGVAFVELEDITSIVAGAGFVSLAIPSTIETLPQALAEPDKLKQFSYFQCTIEKNHITRIKLGFLADNASAYSYTADIVGYRSPGWGYFPWGVEKWGYPISNRPSRHRTLVPIKHQKCVALSFIFKHCRAYEFYTLLSFSFDTRPISTKTTFSRKV